MHQARTGRKRSFANRNRKTFVYAVKAKLSRKKKIAKNVTRNVGYWSTYSGNEKANNLGTKTNTVEALVSDHPGNSKKWSQLELVADEKGLSKATKIINNRGWSLMRPFTENASPAGLF